MVLGDCKRGDVEDLFFSKFGCKFLSFVQTKSIYGVWGNCDEDDVVLDLIATILSFVQTKSIYGLG